MGEIHEVAVVLVVPGTVPERRVEDLRGDDFLVAILPVEPAGIVHQPVVDQRPLREEERARRRLGVEREQLQFLAELAVVALLRLLEEPEMLIELLAGEEGGAVDPLQLLILLVALPVGAGDAEQLERLDPSRRRKVRPATEVDEVTLLVTGDDVAVGLVADQLDLQVIPPALEEPDRVRFRLLDALDLAVAIDDLLHLRFDGRQLVGRERLVPFEVVVEAAVDDRAHADLHVGPQLLHGVGQDVRRRVTVDLERVLRWGEDDLQRAVLAQREGHVHQPAVHLGGDGVAGEPRPDGPGDLPDRRARVHLADGAVRKRHLDCRCIRHGSSDIPSPAARPRRGRAGRRSKRPASASTE